MKIREVSNSSVSDKNVSRREISTAGKPQKTHPLVLVLGKDADTQLLYRSFLEIWCYQVAEAGDINEALPIIEYYRPKLILMDGSLKFENNLEMIQRIRGNMFLNNIPLVLISGHSQPRVQALALKTGADEFLVKPLNFDELRTVLQKYVEDDMEKLYEHDCLS